MALIQVIVVIVHKVLVQYYKVLKLGFPAMAVILGTVCQRVLRACFDCKEIGHWFKELPKHELVS